MRKLFIVLIASLGIQVSFSQDLYVTVVDEQTGEPIPFATVITGEHSGTITNEEGAFTITEKQLTRIEDSIKISSMGYKQVGLWRPSGEMTIKLAANTFQLKQVFLNANPLSAEEVIEQVKLNLDQNYKVNHSKKKIFFRESITNKMNKVDFGFKKSTIAEIDEKLIKDMEATIPKKSAAYTEVVGDFYGNYNAKKLHIDKASRLEDASKTVSIEGLSEKLERIFKENVKPDSYLKIRSGLIGTKVELDSIVSENSEEGEIVKVEVKEDEKPSEFQKGIKGNISSLYRQLFFNESSDLDILEKSNRYEFTHKDYTFIEDAAVYVIDFEPKGRKDFKGTMYVNSDDFAIMRLDFENVRPLKKFGLLGISYRHSLLRGTMLFAREANGGYGPRYLELEDGKNVGIDRPLNVIEKNKHVKGRRKQNELALQIDVQTSLTTKYEMVVFSSENITEGVFQNAPENAEIAPTKLSKYDPNFWKGYTIMEPNEAIRSFEAVE